MVDERRVARQRWRARHGGRGASRHTNYPPELAELPKFYLWVQEVVQEEVDVGVQVQDTLHAASKLPSKFATKFRSIYCHGYHLRVCSAKSHLKTCDSGVAATFTQTCRSGVGDTNHVQAAIEYVGHLEEILELGYGCFRQTVLVASWVQANYRGPNATVKKDRWGFTSCKF